MNKVKELISKILDSAFWFLLIQDPKTKEKSVSLSLLVYSFIIASAKLFVSGSTFHMVIGTKSIDKAFGTFSGSDWALVVGTASALYFGRRMGGQNNGKINPLDGPDKKED